MIQGTSIHAIWIPHIDVGKKQCRSVGMRSVDGFAVNPRFQLFEVKRDSYFIQVSEVSGYDVKCHP